MRHMTFRRTWRLIWATATLTLLPFCVSAQDPERYAAGDGEVLTRILPERIALSIGDGTQRLEVSVYVPHIYDPKESYPLLVVLDADPLLGLLKTLNFLWVEERKSVPVILVGLPFGASANAIWANRSHYLLPRPVEAVEYYGTVVPLNSGGGASDLARFIQDEVLPTVTNKYSVDRERVGLAGFSMGGLFAAWHFVTHPEIFSDYLIIAPPLGPPFVDSAFGDATKQLGQRGLDRSTRLYIAYAENDLEYVLTGASRWVTAWQEREDANLTLRSDVIKDHYHDSGAIPALINGYEFLYGR